jgi:hypothetical protein
VKCRNAQDPAAFDALVAALRGEVQVVSANNRTVKAVIDQMEVEAHDLALTTPGRGSSRLSAIGNDEDGRHRRRGRSNDG